MPREPAILQAHQPFPTQFCHYEPIGWVSALQDPSPILRHQSQSQAVI